MKRGIAQLLFTFDEDTFRIAVLGEEMDDLDKVSTRLCFVVTTRLDVWMGWGAAIPHYSLRPFRHGPSDTSFQNSMPLTQISSLCPAHRYENYIR
jgi:hypothetical protein